MILDSYIDFQPKVNTKYITQANDINKTDGPINVS